MNIRKFLKKLNHKGQDFEARLIMERTAQRDVDTRLKAIELRMKSETPETKRNNT